MKHPRAIVLAAVALGLAAALSACGDNTAGTSGSVESDGSSNSSAVSREADIAFAQLMIPHHQQAVEMADLALENGSSVEVTELAKQIKGAQDPEITVMTQWLTDWEAPLEMPGTEGSDMAGMDHGDMDMGGMSASGMMTEESLDALSQERGADFDHMWLQMMIAHHQGAIAMAEQIMNTTGNPDVAELAQNVVDGQTSEIDTMQQLLTN